jgi:hypothetical protein
MNQLFSLLLLPPPTQYKITPAIVTSQSGQKKSPRIPVMIATKQPQPFSIFYPDVDSIMVNTGKPTSTPDSVLV